MLTRSLLSLAATLFCSFPIVGQSSEVAPILLEPQFHYLQVQEKVPPTEGSCMNVYLKGADFRYPLREFPDVPRLERRVSTLFLKVHPQNALGLYPIELVAWLPKQQGALTISFLAPQTTLDGLRSSWLEASPKKRSFIITEDPDCVRDQIYLVYQFKKAS